MLLNESNVQGGEEGRVTWWWNMAIRKHTCLVSPGEEAKQVVGSTCSVLWCAQSWSAQIKTEFEDHNVAHGQEQGLLLYFYHFIKVYPWIFFFVGRFIVAFLVCLLRHKDINQLWPDHPPSAVCSAVGCLVIIWRTDTICSQILFSRSLCAPKVSAKIACSHLNPFLSSKHSHTHQADSTVGPQFTIHHYLLFLGHRY